MLLQPQHTFAMFSTLILAGDTVVMVFVKPLISVSAFAVSNGLQVRMRLSWQASCLHSAFTSSGCMRHDAGDKLWAIAPSKTGGKCTK